MPRHVDDAPPAPVGGYASAKKQQQGDPTPVSEKSDRALRQVAKYATDPEREHAAKDELRRRSREREEERKRKEAEERDQQLFKRLAPIAERRFFEKHGREPTPKQLSKAVDFMIEDGETDPEGETLGASHGDTYLPDDLAAKRQRERARRSN